MQAVPRELFAPYRQLPGLRSYVADGWRECHTVPLSPCFDEYLQKFSAKKRYNLARQVRLLAKAAGPVSISRIEEVGQVALLFDALGKLLAPGEFANFASRHRYERLAANQLLLSYVVRCGDQPVGVIVATRAPQKWHVHNIFAAQAWHHLSVGTSTIHLALEDVMTHFSFAEADFGYGSPNQDFRSTHVLRTRGHVLAYRPVGAASTMFAAHRVYDLAYSFLAGHAKRLRRELSRRIARRKQRAA
jgi:hypothetical protein